MHNNRRLMPFTITFCWHCSAINDRSIDFQSGIVSNL